MAEIIRMPKLSDTMTEGVIAEWHKQEGDEVKSGDLLAEIESDKATMEFESYEDGTLLHIGVAKGDKAPVNAILAIVGEKGEDVSALLASESTPAEEAAPAVEETAPVAAAAPVPSPAPTASPAPSPVAAAIAPVATASSNGRIKASPLAKRLAQEKGIDIGQVPGSGDGGRIVRRDVDGFKAAPASSGATMGGMVENFTEESISQMRGVIARRLAASKYSAPHFYLTMDIDMDAAMAARKAINASGEVRISFNDMVVKACAMALKKHPKVNSSWLGDRIRFNEHVHIGIAVAVDDGLLVPVVRFADAKGMQVIGEEVKDYATRARSKKLQPHEWEGNTFTISNLGMFGIEEFTAIINSPDACILAVGGIKSIPVVKDGAVVPGNVMKVTLSCDHRVVDGATGSEFLLTLKGFLENPVSMLV